MPIEAFEARFSKRRNIEDPVAEDFDIVCAALLVVDENAIAVYENEDFMEARARGIVIEPALRMLYSDICLLKAKGRIRSEHGTHVVSKIRIYGTFDRQHQECITFTTEVDAHDQLVTLWESHGLSEKMVIH